MDATMKRAFLGLFVLCLPIVGTTVRAIPPPPPDDVRIVKVIDGNTIVVTPYGDPFQVRLACIHSPQLHQGAAGLAAKAALESLLQPGSWVTLATRRKSADGVELAEIIAAGTTVSINLRQVQAGMALMESNASSLCSKHSYREAELSAKTRKLGLWGQPARTNQVQP